MYGITPSETKIMKDLVKELNEFNSYVKAGVSPFGREYMKGNYFYAFNPAETTDNDTFKRNIKLLSTITELLDENCINIKSLGYTYLKDALCIITDRKRLDLCMVKEVYPYIAEKHSVKKVSKIEHSIRNALEAAYRRCKSKYPERDCIMNCFEEKPTNKMFLLRAVQEVSSRLLKEISA
ncbi:MAG: hypothetical protein IJJ06_11520 [Mogibacterium sp.]|nr:hypothetical protein [Mogibacterium sp.]